MSESKQIFEQVLAALEHFEPQELALLEQHLHRLRSKRMAEVSVPEHFPPKIKELLRKKGWNWPPDEKLKAQMWEAAQKFLGSMRTDPRVLEKVRQEDFPGRFPEAIRKEGPPSPSMRTFVASQALTPIFFGSMTL